MEHEVTIDQEVCQVKVNQRSKSVWVASGTCRGKHVTVEGRSESQAIAAWRDAAAYQTGMN